MMDQLTSLIAAVHEVGSGGYVLLTLGIAAGVLLLAPTTPMAVGAGLAYGLYGAPAALVGATLGSTAASLLARSLLRRRFAALVEARPGLRAVLRAIEQEGWRVVCLIRFGSPIPGPIFSYCLGLTRIPITTIASATLVGKAVPVTVWVWVGATGRSALLGSELPLLQLSLVSAAALMTAAAVGLVARRTRAILRSEGAARVP